MEGELHRLEDVAFSTCSSSLEFEAPNQEDMVGARVGGGRGGGDGWREQLELARVKVERLEVREGR